VNFCGNAVATLFIAHWDKALDRDRVRRVLRGEDVAPLHEIDEVSDPAAVSVPGQAATPAPRPAAHPAEGVLAGVNGPRPTAVTR
jgi:aerobic C4-dicarboxylate transport protein